jgi:prepilin peptidase CpaA
VNHAILIALYLVLAGAALQDVAMLRISNLFPVTVIILFGAWLFENGIPSSFWQNGVLFLIIFALGLALFAARWLGGGDVKLLAAGALWFDLGGGLALLVYMSLCGGLLSLVLVFGRRLIPAPARDRLGWPGLKPKGPIPYGVAISAGILWALALHGPNPSGTLKLPDLHISAFPDKPVIK